MNMMLASCIALVSSLVLTVIFIPLLINLMMVLSFTSNVI